MSNKKTWDFGFSLVDEDELKSLERELTVENEKVTRIASTYKEKYESLHDFTMGLLKEMSKDPKKAYIHWPDRINKINEFIRYIQDLDGETVIDK